MRLRTLRPESICIALLMYILLVPAVVRADVAGSQEVIINGAKVRMLVKDGKTYIANKGPGDLVLKYDNGREMCRIPAGGAIMLSGFKGVTAQNGFIKVGKPTVKTKLRGSKSKGTFTFQIAISSTTPKSITINPRNGKDSSVNFPPGTGVDAFKAKVAIKTGDVSQKKKVKLVTDRGYDKLLKKQELTSYEDDRTLISLSN